jgi:hypothetical protein
MGCGIGAPGPIRTARCLADAVVLPDTTSGPDFCCAIATNMLDLQSGPSIGTMLAKR